MHEFLPSSAHGSTAMSVQKRAPPSDSCPCMCTRVRVLVRAGCAYISLEGVHTVALNAHTSKYSFVLGCLNLCGHECT